MGDCDLSLDVDLIFSDGGGLTGRVEFAASKTGCYSEGGGRGFVAFRGIKFTTYFPESVCGSRSVTVSPEAVQSFVSSSSIISKGCFGSVCCGSEFFDCCDICWVLRVVGFNVIVGDRQTLKAGLVNHSLGFGLGDPPDILYQTQ